MANNLASGLQEKLLDSIAVKVESKIVTANSVNRQLIQGKFDGRSGETIYVERQQRYSPIETADGDITGQVKDVVSGRAPATVQNFISVPVQSSWKEATVESAAFDQFADRAASEIAARLDSNLNDFILKNSGLYSGAVGTPVANYADVVRIGAQMQSLGAPMDESTFLLVNPYVHATLAETQGGLASGDNEMVNQAWKKAHLARQLGGMNVLGASLLKTFTSSDSGDRAGTLAANPDVTYATAKDTMRQTLSVAGFSASAVFKAGDIIEITGRNRINPNTREAFLDESGAAVPFSGTVYADVTLDGAGAGVIVITGPAIYEAGLDNNTCDSAPISGDVITLLGTASQVLQPSLYFHKDAFCMANIMLEKLAGVESHVVALPSTGLSLRISTDGDILTGKTTTRVDMLPAFGVMNPNLAGHGWG